LKNFNSDFGGQVYQQFTVAASTIGVKDYIFTSVNSLNVYPNPSDGKITINVDLNKRQNGSVEITDVLGRMVYEYKFSEQIAASIEANLSSQAKGIYFVKLKTENDILTKRIVVQH